MTPNKPKGKSPSLIGGSNGKPELVEVKRASACKRCKENIRAGDFCAAIPKLGTGYKNAKRYCRACFDAILDQTQKDLDSLREL